MTAILIKHIKDFWEKFVCFQGWQSAAVIKQRMEGGAAWTQHTGEWKSSAFYPQKVM